MDGTPGTMCFIPVTRNHQRRSSIAFHHSCSSNSDDAAVPAVTIDHDAEGLAQRWILLEAMFNFLENAAFFFLAFTIELIQAGCNLASPARVFHAVKLYYVWRPDHVPGALHVCTAMIGNVSTLC